MKRIFTISARNSKDDSVKLKSMNLTNENCDMRSISDCDTTRSSMSVTTDHEETKTKQKKSVKFCKRVSVIVLDKFDLNLKSHDLWYTNMEIQLFRKETTSHAICQRKSTKETISRLLKSLESVSST